MKLSVFNLLFYQHIFLSIWLRDEKKSSYEPAPGRWWGSRSWQFFGTVQTGSLAESSRRCTVKEEDIEHQHEPRRNENTITATAFNCLSVWISQPQRDVSFFSPQAKLEVAATLGEGKDTSNIKGPTLACVRKGNFSGAEASVLWFCRGRRFSGDRRYSIDLNQIFISFIWQRLNAEPMRVY